MDYVTYGEMMGWLTTPMQVKHWCLSVVLLAAAAVPALIFLPTRAATPKRVLLQEPEAERLAREYLEAHNQGDWARAIDAGLKLTALLPNSSRHEYNLACAYARNAELDNAVEWLSKAAANGFAFSGLCESDPDLENLRGHAGFEAALSVVKRNREKALTELEENFKERPMHVILPPGYDESHPAPLIVVLHGYGGGAGQVANQWKGVAAEMGAILIAPWAVFQTPNGSGVTWIDPNRTNDPTCTDDGQFLVQLALELAFKKYLIDKERMVLTGFSQGGIIAISSGPRSPHRFAGVIPMGAGYIRRFDAPPKTAGERPPRFYFMQGEYERNHDQIRLAVADFRKAGFQTELRIYPNAGHQFPLARDEELRKALDFVLER